MGHRRVRRRVIVAAVVVGVLLGGAVVGRRLWLNDQARQLSADEAVRRFRDRSAAPSTTVAAAAESTTTTVAPSHSTPAPGVYRYSTDGAEAIDVLGGTEHGYPAQTTITVTPDSCGVLLRWDLLKERHEEWRLCAAVDGIVLQSTGAFYHEFFGTGRLESLTCNRTVLIVPSDRLARDPVPVDCALDERPWPIAWEVLERDTRDVEGVAVPVVHVRMTVDDDSHYYEHTVCDWWLDDHGLPVAMAATKESRSDSGIVGDVVYKEHYAAALDSLAPLR